MQSTIKISEETKTQRNENKKKWKHEEISETVNLKNKFLKAYINNEKIIKFGDIEIKKQKFHQYKEPISVI